MWRPSEWPSKGECFVRFRAYGLASEIIRMMENPMDRMAWKLALEGVGGRFNQK